MSPDLIKKFVVKIEYTGIKSSGVIFKPTKNSNYGYIITAKHSFFSNNKDNSYKENFIDFEKADLKITQELSSESINSDELFSKVYLLDYSEDESIDLAFLVVDLKKAKLLQDVHHLEVEDSEDCNYDIKNQDFFIVGYPNHSTDREVNKIHPHKVRYLQNTEESSSYFLEEFFDYNRSIDADIKYEIKGLSGSGVFILNNRGKAKLRSILIEVDRHDTFVCVKLDVLIDRTNDRLGAISDLSPSLDQVQCGDKIFIEKEELDFSEYSDLSFFQDYVDKKRGWKSL